eukprot:tig00000654_g2808.t1
MAAGGGWNAAEGVLDLQFQGLKEWPSAQIAAAGHEQIRKLDLDHNEIKSIPGNELARLVNLRELHLQNNLLVSLPPEIGRLTALVWLQLRANQLSSLPPEIGRLPNLRAFSCRPNPLTDLPPAARESNESVLAYLREAAAAAAAAQPSAAGAAAAAGRPPLVSSGSTYELSALLAKVPSLPSDPAPRPGASSPSPAGQGPAVQGRLSGSSPGTPEPAPELAAAAEILAAISKPAARPPSAGLARRASEGSSTPGLLQAARAASEGVLLSRPSAPAPRGTLDAPAVTPPSLSPRPPVPSSSSLPLPSRAPSAGPALAPSPVPSKPLAVKPASGPLSAAPSAPSAPPPSSSASPPLSSPLPRPRPAPTPLASAPAPAAPAPAASAPEQPKAPRPAPLVVPAGGPLPAPSACRSPSEGSGGGGGGGAGRRDPRSMRVSDVCEWLRSLELDKVAPAFAENGVDGKLLLHLTDAELRDELGVASGLLRRRILSEASPPLLRSLLAPKTFVIAELARQGGAAAAAAGGHSGAPSGAPPGRSPVPALTGPSSPSSLDPDGKRWDIFVSYAHADQAVVFRFVDALVAAGFSVWIDRELLPGRDWLDDIGVAMGECRAFVCFISRGYLASVNCEDELKYAHHQLRPRPSKYPVWLVHPDVLLPSLSPGMKMMLSDCWVTQQDVEEAITFLIAGLRNNLRRFPFAP